MDNKKYCKHCDYNAPSLYAYKRHLNTNKHTQNATNGQDKIKNLEIEIMELKSENDVLKKNYKDLKEEHSQVLTEATEAYKAIVRFKLQNQMLINDFNNLLCEVSNNDKTKIVNCNIRINKFGENAFYDYDLPFPKKL